MSIRTPDDAAKWLERAEAWLSALRDYREILQDPKARERSMSVDTEVLRRMIEDYGLDRATFFSDETLPHANTLRRVCEEHGLTGEEFVEWFGRDATAIRAELREVCEAMDAAGMDPTQTRKVVNTINALLDARRG
jgi:crotonobetainyl-CoA:carnitine CoA-transferase CaiB-like acyl-CoA transferase